MFRSAFCDTVRLVIYEDDPCDIFKCAVSLFIFPKRIEIILETLMKQFFLITILSFLTLTSALAAEDNQPVPASSETTPAIEHRETLIVNQKKPFRYLVGMGFTSGGDTLFDASYSDGSTDSVTAGGELMFYGGVDYRLNDVVSLQGTLGYHFDSTKPATNGEVSFNRWPLELLAYYHVKESFRLGGGFRIINNPKLEGSGIASSVSESYANTMGLVIEGEYLVGPTFGIKLRHVSEKYKVSGGSSSIDGSHLGILASFYF